MLRMTCVSVCDVDCHEEFLEVEEIVAVRVEDAEDVGGDLGGVSVGEDLLEERSEVVPGQLTVRTLFAEPEMRERNYCW